MHKRKKNGGFTLIDLVVALAIVTVMISIGVPNMIRWLENYRLRTAITDFYACFQLARLTAAKRGHNCALIFNQAVDGTTYDLVVVEDADNDLEYDNGENVIGRVSLSAYRNVEWDTSQGTNGLTFTANDDSKPAVAFRMTGLPTNNAGGFGAGSAFLINTRTTETRSLVLSSAGNIRLN